MLKSSLFRFSVSTAVALSSLAATAATLTVKNQSNRRACVAIVEASPVQSRGWFVIENGASKTFYGVNYFHAEECGNKVSWKPAYDIRYFCLRRSNGGAPFSFYTPDNSSMCGNLGGVMEPYYRVATNLNYTLNY